MDNLISNMLLLRKAKPLTQAQMGKIMRKSAPLVSLIENGERKPDMGALLHFMEYFSISEEDLRQKALSPMDAMLLARNAPSFESYMQEAEGDRHIMALAPDIHIVQEDEIKYMPSATSGGVQQYDSIIGSRINDLLKKHHTNRTRYAKERLGVTVRTLQRMISGDITVSFAAAATIAEDHGESLDYFRIGQLPAGHMIEQNKLLQEQVAEQSRVIAGLLKKLEKCK